MLLSLHSRIHLLRPPAPKRLYLKRDDELSFGVSGSKMRKYSSLLPSFQKLGARNVVMVGGANSNNIAGGVQLFLEHGITPHLVLRKPGGIAIHMNQALISYLMPDERIHWIERKQWAQANDFAHALAKKLHNCLVLPEGACCIEALEGAKTLAQDICRNEEEENILFSDIVVDAGTGIQALGMIEGFQLLKKNVRVHIVEIAVKKEEFKEFAKKFSIPLNLPLSFHKPVTAASFGSVNKKLLCFMQEFAREQGVLLDPIYSAKLALTAFTLAKEGVFQENALLVHSGGGISTLDLLLK